MITARHYTKIRSLASSPFNKTTLFCKGLVNMTDRIFEQIMEVRASGACNMLDTIAVQRYAHDHDMYELVIFIEEQKKAYCAFILTGERTKE